MYFATMHCIVLNNAIFHSNIMVYEVMLLYLIGSKLKHLVQYYTS